MNGKKAKLLRKQANQMAKEIFKQEESKKVRMGHSLQWIPISPKGILKRLKLNFKELTTITKGVING